MLNHVFLDLGREIYRGIEQNFTNKAAPLTAVGKGADGLRVDVSRSVTHHRLGAGNRVVQVQRRGWSQKTCTEQT